jgi:aspartate ammonia-lyase
MDTHTRIEQDLLGDVAVPVDALYGAQTARARANFPTLGARTLGDYPPLVRALLRVKRAAASANRAAGFLDPRVAAAILGASDEVLTRHRAEEFPIHALHGGGGTSANMNANEVLANLAEERLGGRRGEYRLVHPVAHVNLHQSTNDVYPTACHLAVLDGWTAVDAALGHLAATLRGQAGRWSAEPRLARTCLQDAVETSFGDLLGAYAAFVERGRSRAAGTVDRLREVNLGGTIVGRQVDVPEPYASRVVEALRGETEDARLVRAENLFDAAQHVDDMVSVSAALALLSRGLIKIAKDLRLLASGPEAGLGELEIPAVQPGSSIMPGKVNPVIPEFVIQVCCRVVGHDAACAMAVDHGELDLNVWESLVVVSLLDSIALLGPALTAFADACVVGIRPRRRRNEAHVNTIVPLLTRLAHQRGYGAITDICRRAGRDPDDIRRLLTEEHLL